MWTWILDNVFDLESYLRNAFLIPLIPAVSFLVILLFGRSVIGVERVHKVGMFNSRPVIADDGIVVVARLQERKAPVQLELDAVREDVENEVLSEKRQQAVETETSRILEELETLEDYSAVAQEVELEWKRVDDAHQSSSDMPSNVLEEAFKVIIPSDGSRVVTHTDLSGGSKAIIVVSGATLGDYAATTEDERNDITQGLSTDSGSSEFSGFLESLRDDASIAIKLASTSAPP